jgi:putative spermidine/putrescine transport system permease protein
MRTSFVHRSGVAALYAFLLAPIAIILPMSFSNDPVIAFPPVEWGGHAYAALLSNREFMRTFVVSAILASASVLLCLATGVPAAYAAAFHHFPGRGLVLGLLTLPLLLPSIVVGLALLLLFVRLNLIATYTGLAIGHGVLALPYVVRMAVTAFGAVSPDLCEAAVTLGASPWQVALRVRLPLIRPAILASAAIVFLISFDELVVSLFLVGPRLSTLPVEVFRHVDLRADPEVAALATVLVGFSLAIILVLERTVGLARALR